MTRVRALLVAILLVCLLLAAVLLNKNAADQYRWLCEFKGHLWVQPTHGEPYCGDGSGNPPDRDANQEEP